MAIKKLQKKLVKAINTIEDEKFLKAIELLIDDKKENEFEYELTPQQEKELFRRSESLRNSTAKLVTWNEMKKELTELKRSRLQK